MVKQEHVNAIRKKNYFSPVFGMTVQYKCPTWTVMQSPDVTSVWSRFCSQLLFTDVRTHLKILFYQIRQTLDHGFSFILRRITSRDRWISDRWFKFPWYLSSCSRKSSLSNAKEIVRAFVDFWSWVRVFCCPIFCHRLKVKDVLFWSRIINK